jgi:phage nucleotide-binding protein
MKLTTTREAAHLNGLKVLVYGGPGAGKTTLCATLPAPIILSAEAGLLSLRHVDVPVIEVSTLEDVEAAYTYLLSPAAEAYQWVCLDSISEIAEVVLSRERKATKDPRQAYGALAEHMFDLLRAFRDLPRNIYMSSKMEKTKDEITGAMLYSPSLPGQRLGQGIGYLFDELFALRVERDPEGQPTRWLQTGSDKQYQGKDRSGTLELFEPADLGAIATKITRTVNPISKE